MTSDYLDQTRSLDELDAFFEKDRQAAVELAEVVFSQEVAAAIRTIADINEVANARILADTQVSSAKIASSAEVHATALLAAAELLRLKIQNRKMSEPTRGEIDSSVVSEFTRVAEGEIKGTSRSAVEQINAEARLAIAKISENAKEAISQINNIATKISNQVHENARIAKGKLQEAQKSPRTPESVAIEAEKAAVKISAHAVAASESLMGVVKETIDAMMKSADVAVGVISKTVKEATERIVDARDKALKRIHGFLTLW